MFLLYLPKLMQMCVVMSKILILLGDLPKVKLTNTGKKCIDFIHCDLAWKGGRRMMAKIHEGSKFFKKW